MGLSSTFYNHLYYSKKTVVTCNAVITGSESSEGPNQQGRSRDILELLMCCQCMRPSVMLLSVLSVLKTDHPFGKKAGKISQAYFNSLTESNKSLFIQCL